MPADLQRPELRAAPGIQVAVVFRDGDRNCQLNGVASDGEGHGEAAPFVVAGLQLDARIADLVHRQGRGGDGGDDHLAEAAHLDHPGRGLVQGACSVHHPKVRNEVVAFLGKALDQQPAIQASIQPLSGESRTGKGGLQPRRGRNPARQGGTRQPLPSEPGGDRNAEGRILRHIDAGLGGLEGQAGEVQFRGRQGPRPQRGRSERGSEGPRAGQGEVQTRDAGLRALQAGPQAAPEAGRAQEHSGFQHAAEGRQGAAPEATGREVWFQRGPRGAVWRWRRCRSGPNGLEGGSPWDRPRKGAESDPLAPGPFKSRGSGMIQK
ncbi:MAG: hypothetical protein BWY56_02518 [Acidobacteria bacterium ADurb.Bin340]|nr:MAG: hypothetical protein BWY56_02518 [Acidobacteria bacterium ADurb.Bin340]